MEAIIEPITPAEVCGHLTKGKIELSVNSETRQEGDLSDLINSVSEVSGAIAHLSRFYHLQAGDLIYTGTPSGVGPVVAGDHLQGKIEGLGTIDLSIT